MSVPHYGGDFPVGLDAESDEDLSFLEVGPSAAQYLQNKRPRITEESQITPVGPSDFTQHVSPLPSFVVCFIPIS